MVDTELANLSNQLMLGAVLMYVVAMFGYAADLAFGHRRRAAAEQAPAKAKVLVGAGGSEPEAVTPGGAADTGDDEASLRREVDWRRFGVLLSVLGWGLHLGALVTRGVAAERWPWGNMYEFMVAITFAAVTAYLVLLFRQRIEFLGAFVMLFAVVSLGIATLWLYTDVGPLVPALKSYWIAIHVTAAIIATGAFTVAGLSTILYLVTSRGVTGNGRLPAPETLDRLAHRVTMFSFPIWTFAIIAGAIWADEAWGRYWNWDPKEIWSFVTWVVYAGYLHARATAGWKGRKAAIVSLVAYGCLLFNFFGVNYMFSGLHSYA
ncbi:c-type cytochrome biogenesis protein CcsB [Actinomadura alba]|uniref:C-type cytochrome biogenesis protein CcsB n=1 Tax=Actinomadura alba TaxID=406431 RepID=A0ABR7LW83_9ACTN|nr:c-type cytochrome biogenesis protein CcsB [Actinomadura alba]MBC6469029.1 c-type cytochrome biogenesis protein CcsB [Actinomadura alba]